MKSNMYNKLCSVEDAFMDGCRMSKQVFMNPSTPYSGDLRSLNVVFCGNDQIPSASFGRPKK